MSTKQPPKQCAYCGCAIRITRDHIPPRAVFPDGATYRQGLITVPACHDCNRSFSSDDEYFALTVASHALTGANPLAAGLHERMKRAVIHTLHGRMGQKIRSEFGLIDVRTPAGVYTGKKQPVRKLDSKVMARVGVRMLKGLHFHHFGRRVDSTAVVDFKLLRDIPLRTHADNELMRPYRELLHPKPLHDIGPGVFKYRFSVADDNPAYSLWIMTLYEAIEFIGAIRPKDQVSRLIV